MSEESELQKNAKIPIFRTNCEIRISDDIENIHNKRHCVSLRGTNGRPIMNGRTLPAIF